MNEELIKTACSGGQDKDIQKYFTGRTIELAQALSAFEEHGMVAIGGYGLSGKTYLALKLLDQIDARVKRDSYTVTKELISGHTPVLGIMCEVNAGQALHSIQSVFDGLLRGSADYQGLLLLVEDTSHRRELNLKFSTMLMRSGSGQKMPPSNLKEMLSLLSEVISILKTQFQPKEFIVCLDGIDSIEDSNALHELVDCLLKAEIKLIFTFNTNLKYFPINQLAERFPQLQSIYINRLADDEANKLIKLLETNTNYSLRFEPEACELIKLATGNIPYFIHFLCAPAMLAAYRTNKSIITKNDVALIIQSVHMGHYTSLFEMVFENTTNTTLQMDHLMKYVLMDNSDLCHNEVLSSPSSELPAGGLVMFGDSRFVIANPAIQVYSRMRLGVISTNYNPS